MLTFPELCSKTSCLVWDFLAFRRAFLDGGSGALMSTSSSVMVVGSRFRFLDDGNGEAEIMPFEEMIEPVIVCLISLTQFFAANSPLTNFLTVL